MRKTISFRPTVGDKLEDRTVPSSFGGRSLTSFFNAGLTGTGATAAAKGPSQAIKVDLGNLGGQIQGSCQGATSSSSSLLAQDAKLVQQAFQALSTSVQSALAALRLTATSTTAPTDFTAYDKAISDAVTTLNSAISSALSNLPNTGASLTATIQGYTATLQTNLQSAGRGLANSTSSALRATRSEANGYIRTALNQSLTAIKNDQPAGTVTASTIQTYNAAVKTAVKAFGTAITNAAQTSIANGTTLDGTAVSSAVATLQSSLHTAISGLGLSPAFDPTAAVDTALASLQSALTAIAAPTANNSASARAFLRSISVTVGSSISSINKTVSTAVVNSNNSLL